MDFLYGEQFTEASPEAYERLLLDVLLGDATLFPRNAEVEASWAVIDPLEEFWAGTTPHPYRAGEWGPRAADEMLGRRRKEMAPTMTTLWDTTGSAVVKELAAQRRTGGAVVVRRRADPRRRRRREPGVRGRGGGDRRRRAAPLPGPVVVRRQIDAPMPRLDAEVLIGGRLGPGEAVVMRMYGRLALHAESVVLPLLAADAPVVTWWHAAAARAHRHRRAGGARRPADHRQRQRRGPARRAAPAGRRLRPGRHRPGLDAQHRLAGHARLHAGLGRRPARRRHPGRRRRGARRPPQRHGAAARGLALLPLRLPDRGRGDRRASGPERGDAVNPARPGRGGAGAGRPPRRRGDQPALPPRLHRRRCPTARSATCWARSCAGWTRTSPTARRWRRRPARPACPSARRCATTSGSTRPSRTATAPTGRRGRPGRSARARRPVDSGTDEVAQQGVDERRERVPRRARRAGAGGRGPPAPTSSSSPTPSRLARAVASALVARLAAAQAVHGTASVVLTGGGIGIAVLERVAALAAEPEQSVVDWTAVDVWWGDERFVPADDAERNEKGARRALLDAVGVPAARVHAMPASDGGFAEPEDAAAWYAGQLAAHAGRRRGPPASTCCCSGMGPEGHVASIFPDSPAARDDRTVVAVRDCPKPPPTRVSLGFTRRSTAPRRCGCWSPARARPMRSPRTGRRRPARAARGRRPRPAGHPLAAGHGRGQPLPRA